MGRSMASLFSYSTLLIISCLLVVVVSLEAKCPGTTPVSGLSYTFYDSSCPNAEFIIRNHLIQVFQNDTTQAAGLLRLHFHDCFVQGCDGSVLLDGTPTNKSEKDAVPNQTLRAEAFKIINDLQALLTKQCGQVVSCADITALAARDSVFLVGGPYYDIPLGRRDSLSFASQNVTNNNLPSPFSNVTVLINAFANKSLDTTDLVALSGGHTIGRGHCASFTNRLYPTQDPNMDQTFANNLKLTCPASNTTNTTVLDIRTPNLFDNKYYVDLMNRQGLFTSDQGLYNDSRTKSIVTSFAVNQSLFFESFVNSMLKMGQISVLTGSQGEIRANCSARNSNSSSSFWSVFDADNREPGTSSSI